MKKLLVLLLLCSGCTKTSFESTGIGYVVSKSYKGKDYPSPYVDRPCWYEISTTPKTEENWSQTKVYPGPPDISIGQKVYLGSNVHFSHGQWHPAGAEFILAEVED
jgi:hypothetical protein